jgi:DNA mismatch repair protein MutS
MVFSQKLAERYSELKSGQPDCLLLMQVGTFMQVMDEDARAVAGVTGLKLKMAGDVAAPVVLGGFPKSGLDAYVGKLVRAGHSVAIAVQDAEKGRSITEVIRLNGSGSGSPQARPPGEGEARDMEGEAVPSRSGG